MSTITDREEQRHLQINGMYNVRDIGGYTTTDGRTTRWRTVIRADSPHRLTTTEQQTLLALGLRTVIDLRRPDEASRYPNTLAAAPGLRYHQVQLDQGPPEDQPVFPSLPVIYRTILDNAQQQLGQVVQLLAASDALPGMVHCQVGKDRTGLVIALLLGAVGVPAETIVADYALSEAQLAGEFARDLEQQFRDTGRNWAEYQHLLGSPPHFMADILHYLDTNHGGVHGYLHSAGITADTIVTLRERLTE